MRQARKQADPFGGVFSFEERKGKGEGVKSFAATTYLHAATILVRDLMRSYPRTMVLLRAMNYYGLLGSIPLVLAQEQGPWGEPLISPKKKKVVEEEEEKRKESTDGTPCKMVP